MRRYEDWGKISNAAEAHAAIGKRQLSDVSGGSEFGL